MCDNSDVGCEGLILPEGSSLQFSMGSMVAGTGGGWSPDVHCHGSESNERWCLACLLTAAPLLFTPVHEMVHSGWGRACWEYPYVQKRVSWMSPRLVTWTIEVKMRGVTSLVTWTRLTHQGFLASSDGYKTVSPRGESSFCCFSSAGWSLLYIPEGITRGAFGGRLRSACKLLLTVFLFQVLQVLILCFLSPKSLHMTIWAS